MTRCLRPPLLLRSRAVPARCCFVVSVLMVCGFAAAEEDRSCDDALFDPITVSMSDVSGVEALEMVVRTTGLELELNAEVEGNVELAEEYKPGLDVLDEIAAQLDLEWTQYGCRVIVTATDKHESSEADNAGTKAD